MSEFSVGELVWGTTDRPRSGLTMVPAVVVRATDPDDPASCHIAFVKPEHKSLEDVCNQKPFVRARTSLYLFDPTSACKFAPNPGANKDLQRSRKDFDKRMTLATKLHEDHLKQVREEYQRACEKATARDPAFANDDDENSDPAPELAAGAHIFFWIPGMIAGRTEARMYARVLTVRDRERYEKSQIPLELDSGHVLTLDDSIQMLKPVETKLIPLRKFKLQTSSVAGVRMADVICRNVQSHIDQMKEENPAYADFFRDIFGSTRKENNVGKQERKDGDYTPIAKKPAKKKKPPSSEPKKEETPKVQDTPRDRPGWRPDCDDSEDEDEDKIKYLPQLAVPNRAESQGQSSTPSVALSLSSFLGGRTDATRRESQPCSYESDFDEDEVVERVKPKIVSPNDSAVTPSPPDSFPAKPKIVSPNDSAVTPPPPDPFPAKPKPSSPDSDFEESAGNHRARIVRKKSPAAVTKSRKANGKGIKKKSKAAPAEQNRKITEFLAPKEDRRKSWAGNRPKKDRINGRPDLRKAIMDVGSGNDSDNCRMVISDADNGALIQASDTSDEETDVPLWQRFSSSRRSRRAGMASQPMIDCSAESDDKCKVSRHKPFAPT